MYREVTKHLKRDSDRSAEIMLPGYDHLTGYSKKITTDHNFWVSYVYRNFDATLKIIMQTLSNDTLTCFVCRDLSFNFQSKSSLANHYRYSHKRQVVDYYLKHFIEKTPDELKQMLNYNTHSVNSIERGVIQN